VVAYLFVVIPLGGSADNGEGNSDEKTDPIERKKQRTTVPSSATERCRWDIPDDAGLDFAKLTGDFNPLHWVGPYAKMAGFPNVILHGFSTMARAYEGLKREAVDADESIEVLDVKFTKPLVLPAEVGLFTDDDGGVFVGDAPGESSYMSGVFESS
jgi:hypothetical protein